MSRPFPVVPRGPRRLLKRPQRAVRLFACPRVSPEWELAALGVLMKPQAHTKGSIRHRPAEQPWPADAAGHVAAACGVIRERLGVDFAPALPPAGDYWMLAEVPEHLMEEAKALAVVLSSRLPDHWFVLDRLFVHAGRFYRRERGYKLNLVEASNVHLTRAIRAAIRG